MSEQYPFLELFEKFNSADVTPNVVGGSAHSDPSPRSRDWGEKPDVQALFKASVNGVQSGFNHLSTEDIAHPPHRWFDAALARQIAFHIMINRFDVPRRRLSIELERSREAVLRAMRTVDERLLNEDFASSYEAMAEIADQSINDKVKDGDQS